MSVLTFTPTTVVTVTIGADSFRDEATHYAAAATTWASEASTTARYAATYVDGLTRTGWTSPGGASADEVYAMVLADNVAAVCASREARAAAIKADAASDAQHAAWAADGARQSCAVAMYHAESARRLHAYLCAANAA